MDPASELRRCWYLLLLPLITPFKSSASGGRTGLGAVLAAAAPYDEDPLGLNRTVSSSEVGPPPMGRGAEVPETSAFGRVFNLNWGKEGRGRGWPGRARLLLEMLPLLKAPLEPREKDGLCDGWLEGTWGSRSRDSFGLEVREDADGEGERDRDRDGRF